MNDSKPTVSERHSRNPGTLRIVFDKGRVECTLKEVLHVPPDDEKEACLEILEEMRFRINNAIAGLVFDEF